MDTNIEKGFEAIPDPEEEEDFDYDPDGQGGFGSGVLKGIDLHFYGEGSFTSLFELNFFDGTFVTNLGEAPEVQIGKPVSFQIDMNSPTKVSLGFFIDQSH